MLYVSHISIKLEGKKNQGATCRHSLISATVPWEIKDNMIQGGNSLGSASEVEKCRVDLSEPGRTLQELA